MLQRGKGEWTIISRDGYEGSQSGLGWFQEYRVHPARAIAMLRMYGQMSILLRQNPAKLAPFIFTTL